MRDGQMILILSTFAFVLVSVIYQFAVVPRMTRKDRITSKTVGTVIGYKYFSDTGIKLPHVQYEVEGSIYKVIGPSFLSVTSLPTKKIEDPETVFITNIESISNLPDHFKIRHRGIIPRFKPEDPIRRYFPEGMKVDVYFNPSKPKEAYVIRDEGIDPMTPKMLRIMMVIFAVVSMISAVSSLK
ncbi:hypothetical protein [Guggenheimella bovis]